MYTLLSTTDTAAEKWVNPLLPLTDEEHEKILDETESGTALLAEEAEEYSKGLIEKWSNKK